MQVVSNEDSGQGDSERMKGRRNWLIGSFAPEAHPPSAEIHWFITGFRKRERPWDSQRIKRSRDSNRGINLMTQ